MGRGSKHYGNKFIVICKFFFFINILHLCQTLGCALNSNESNDAEISALAFADISSLAFADLVQTESESEVSYLIDNLGLRDIQQFVRVFFLGFKLLHFIVGCRCFLNSPFNHPLLLFCD